MNVSGYGGVRGRGVALRLRFSLQILYDSFDLIAIILRGKVEFSSRGKMKSYKWK